MKPTKRITKVWIGNAIEYAPGLSQDRSWLRRWRGMRPNFGLRKWPVFAVWTAWMGLAPILLSAPAVQPVSQPFAEGITAAGDSFQPVLSADGSRLAFVSVANNLVTNDDLGPYTDIFVKRLDSREIVLASVAGTGAGGGNGHSSEPALSGDGRRLVFSSEAANLVAGDTNGATDIFIRDLDASFTRLATVAAGGAGSALGRPPHDNLPLSGNPQISLDGRWLAFESYATNLTGLPDSNNALDVYIQDLETATSLLVSVRADGTGSGSGESRLGGISGDGRWVVFTSRAGNLVTQATVGEDEVFAWDRVTGRTYWVSDFKPEALAAHGTSGTTANDPVISANGRFAAFKMGEQAVFRADLTALPATRRLAWREADLAETSLAISEDGRYVGVETGGAVALAPFHASVLHRLDFETEEADACCGGTVVGTDVDTNRLPVMTWIADLTTDGNWRTTASYPFGMAANGDAFVFLANRADLHPQAAEGSPQLYLRELNSPVALLLSARPNGEPGADLSAFQPTLSADARWVAWPSSDSMTVSNDLNRAMDIFVWDRTSNATTLVSARHAERVAHTGVSLTKLETSALSGDGRRIVLSALDGNLRSGDTNRFQDLFVFGLESGERWPIIGGFDPADPKFLMNPRLSGNGRVLVYVEGRGRFLGGPGTGGPTGTFGKRLWWRDLDSGEVRWVGDLDIDSPNRFSYAPAISWDGRKVAYQFNPDPFSFLSRTVYWRDMGHTNQNPLVVSARLDGQPSNDHDSYDALISPLGDWVVFKSLARDLATNVVDGLHGQLFARHIPTQTTHLISKAESGAGLSGTAASPVFSGDGRYVAFHSQEARIGYRHDLLETSPNVEICTECQTLSLNFDGTLCAYATMGQDGMPGQVYVKNLMTQELRLISERLGGEGEGNGDSFGPLLGADGRFVVFESRADDLVANDGNRQADLFVKDLTMGTTHLISRSWVGDASANERSFRPVMSGDGRTVAFQSFANDLTPGDYNLTADVFLLRLGSGDTDGDGMEDDWEVAYFGNLERDGTGDADGDGQTDMQEFLAGTNPNDQKEYLRVLRLIVPLKERAILIWSSVPGKSYRVEYKENLSEDAWSVFPNEVLAVSGSTSLQDPQYRARRFYRVRLNP